MMTLTRLMLAAMNGTNVTTTPATTTATTPVVTTAPTTAPAITSLEDKITENVIVKNNMVMMNKARELATNNTIITTATTKAEAVVLNYRNTFAVQTFDATNNPYSNYAAVPDAEKPIVDAMVLNNIARCTGTTYEDIGAYQEALTEEYIKAEIRNNTEYKNTLRGIRLSVEMMSE